MTSSPLEYYVALGGDLTAQRIVEIAQAAETLGFKRLYLYDDLLSRPAWPMLALVARHTKRIRIGPCLVNGMVSHPATLAKNAIFLDEVSEGRALLGVGRGAFLELLGLDYSEAHTRSVCAETMEVIRHFVRRAFTPFEGDHFCVSENAVMDFPSPRRRIPMVVGSWNTKMAWLAGTAGEELQVADIWEPWALAPLSLAFRRASGRPYGGFSIGGISCVADDPEKARNRTRKIIARYLPHLGQVLRRGGIDANSPMVQRICNLSRSGRLEESATALGPRIIDCVALVGSPDVAIEKLTRICESMSVQGVMFSPPFGVEKATEQNLKYLWRNVIAPLSEKLSASRISVKSPPPPPH